MIYGNYAFTDVFKINNKILNKLQLFIYIINNKKKRAGVKVD